MKKGKMLMLLALGCLISGISLTAAETKAENTPTYIAVTMHMFNKLTGKKQEKKTPEYFTYQDDKLVKCEADLQALKKECKKNKNSKNCDTKKKGKKHFGRHHKSGSNNKFVLLTQDQMKNLMKQKCEQKGKDINNPDSKMAKAFNKVLEAAPVVTVNGKDAKVVTPKAMFKELKNGKGCAALNSQTPVGNTE